MAELAIGAISFGIQVCGGLVKYCRAVSKRSKEIEDITAQIQNLELAFRTLDPVLTRAALLPSSDQATVASAIVAIEGCEAGITELQKFLDSISDSGGDVKGKARDVGRRLAFGFRQDDVASLKQNVQGLTTTVELTLQALSVDLGLNHGEQMASLGAAMDSKLSLMETRITGNLKATLSTVDVACQDTSTSTKLVVQNVQSVDNRLASLERLIMRNYELEDTRNFSQGLSQVSGAQLLARPAMLREACDVVSVLPVGNRATGTRRRSRPTSSRCGCDLQKRTRSATFSSKSVGIAVLSNECQEVSQHSPHCQFYIQTKTVQRRVGARFHARVWSQLSVLVQASLVCTAGAGGFSISSPLSFLMTVENSPARAEIEALSPYLSNSELIKSLMTAERRILKMFQAKEASPHDRFLDGSNLLHAVMESYCEIIEIRDDIPNTQVISQSLRFVEALVTAGVPCDELSLSRRTPIELLFNGYIYPPYLPAYAQQMRIELSLGITSLSSDIPSLNTTDPILTLKAITGSPVLRHGLAPLATAILGNSEEDLRSILAEHPHSINERTYGMTVLHLSSQWPAGLSILLSTGAAELIDEKCRTELYTAVDLALYFGCTEAVALLFDAGCVWHGFIDGTTLDNPPSACIRTVACKLAERRTRLMCLAEATLTESQLSTIRRGGGVLDLDAAAVVRMVTAAGRDVPPALGVPDSYATIYLSGNLDISHLPIFFDFGFHDIGPKRGQGYMPIQVASLNSRIGFRRGDFKTGFLTPGLLERLENRGFLDPAPPGTLLPGTNSSATGWHILAFRLTLEMWGYLPYPSRDREFSEQVREAFLRVCSCLAADSCKCACSSAGCLPLTIGLKTAAKHRVWGQDWLSTQDDTAGELLRFLTFEALEMTHTCCIGTEEYIDFRGYGQIAYVLKNFKGSIEEIHEDEEELHRRLEELVSEFNARFAEAGESLTDFVWGYWRERMATECVPVRDEDGIFGGESGVNFEAHYSTPERLQYILGRDFKFEDTESEDEDQ